VVPTSEQLLPLTAEPYRSIELEFSLIMWTPFPAEDDWITVPSPVSKVDALGDSDTLFESTSSKSEDGGEENEEISEVFGYERLKASSTDPAPKINLKRREAYLSSEEFEKLFGITQTQFYEMPKWKQDQRKKVVDLF
jgi:hypothetical protein